MKKLLLDTHVFLWLRSNPLKLSQTALQAYEDPNNTVYLSMASVWEMQIKVQLGQTPVNSAFARVAGTTMYHQWFADFTH